MTDYIIYHEVKPGVACPDGIMAAAIAKMAIPDAVLIGDSYRHKSEYGDTPNVEGFCGQTGDRLVIVDFSYPAKWLHQWEELGIEITLIDHHAPKFPHLAGFSGAILDANECGATLTWRHFFPNIPQPEILKHVRRRDIGADGYYLSDENCSDSKAVTAALEFLRKNKTVDEQVLTCRYWLGLESCDPLEELGERLLAEDDLIVASIAVTAIESSLYGYVCGKVQTSPETDRLASQIGNAIARQHPEWAFAWVVSADGSLNSLRSASHTDVKGFPLEPFDVSAVAQEMGGDGHRAAAGFVTCLNVAK